jgi:hypothetical protein
MIIKGEHLQKGILRDGESIDEIEISDDKIKFNDYGYAIANGRLFKNKTLGRVEVEGSNIKGIIDKKGNEIFPFKAFNDTDDNIPGLALAGTNVISKEGIDDNGNPLYKHTKIIDDKVRVTSENHIIESSLNCSHYQFLNNHTLLGTILYNLNPNGRVKIYYSKKFLYSMLYRGAVVSEFFNDIIPLKYDDHANILKANAMFYALEPKEDCWLPFYQDGSFVTGEYPITCCIDDRGNALPPFSCKALDKNISIESVKQEDPNFTLEIVRQKVLKKILEYELVNKKKEIATLLKDELQKYSLAALKGIPLITAQSMKFNPNSDFINYVDNNMANEEIERRSSLVKKQHPNL